MPRCVTIIPSNCQNEYLSYVNKVCIRTHQATCDSDLHFLDHDILTPEGQDFSDNIETELTHLGGHYHHIKEPFNAMRYYNTMVDRTDSEYVAFATADLIFYPGWLDVCINALDENPHLMSAHPYSFSPNWAEGPTYSWDGKNRYQIIETTQPSCHVAVFRRSKLYRWDETFQFHESDTDYFFHLEHHGLKAGICRNSRVDHIGHVFVDNSKKVDYGFSDATERLKKKWNR